MKSEFAQRALTYWTQERLQKLTAGKKLLLVPSEAPDLLRTMGLLNSDASMSADSVRKYLQINHMLGLLTTHLDDLAARHPLVRVLDVGCGNSFLTLLVTWYPAGIFPGPAATVNRTTGPPSGRVTFPFT